MATAFAATVQRELGPITADLLPALRQTVELQWFSGWSAGEVLQRCLPDCGASRTAPHGRADRGSMTRSPSRRAGHEQSVVQQALSVPDSPGPDPARRAPRTRVAGRAGTTLGAVAAGLIPDTVSKDSR